MTIGEMAGLAEVSARSLRHYEELGLLSPSRGEQNYREYAQEDLMRIQVIRSLMRSGIALSEIKKMLVCFDGSALLSCPRVVEAYKDQLAKLDRTIEDLVTTRKRLIERLNSTNPAPVFEPRREPGA